MKEIECPYCEHDFDLNHDDGAYYDESDSRETECPKCEKSFMVHSYQSWSFTGEKADCLNGSPHTFEPQSGFPRELFHGRFMCKDCGEEEHRDEQGRKELLSKLYP